MPQYKNMSLQSTNTSSPLFSSLLLSSPLFFSLLLSSLLFSSLPFASRHCPYLLLCGLAHLMEADREGGEEDEVANAIRRNASHVRHHNTAIGMAADIHLRDGGNRTRILVRSLNLDAGNMTPRSTTRVPKKTGTTLSLSHTHTHTHTHPHTPGDARARV